MGGKRANPPGRAPPHPRAVLVALPGERPRRLHPAEPDARLHERADGGGNPVPVHFRHREIRRPGRRPAALPLRQDRVEVTRGHEVVMEVDAARCAARGSWRHLVHRTCAGFPRRDVSPVGEDELLAEAERVPVHRSPFVRVGVYPACPPCQTSQGAPPLDIPAEPLGWLPVSSAARRAAGTAMRADATSTKFAFRSA